MNEKRVIYRGGHGLWLMVLVVLGGVLVLLAVGVGEVSGKTLYVDDDGGEGGGGSLERPFQKIQDAVDAAENGDTVVVAAGNYQEHVDVHTSLSLQGSGPERTVIDAGMKYNCINVTADWVNISGFRIVNGRTGLVLRSTNNRVVGNNCSYNFYAGIDADDGNIITDNVCYQNGGRDPWPDPGFEAYVYGTGISADSRNVIQNNTCLENFESGITVGSYNIIENNSCSGPSPITIFWRDNHLSNNSLQGGGIDVSFLSEDWELKTQEIAATNTVNGMPVYIFQDEQGARVPDDAGQVILFNCGNMTIEGLGHRAESFSIHVQVSDNITISNNRCIRGTSGIRLYYSANCSVLDNNCSGNLGPGIELVGSSYNLLLNNTCSFNAMGISIGGRYLRYSFNNTLRNNRCLNNRAHGLSIRYNSHYNTIVNNIVSFNGDAGLYLSTSYENSIHNNTFATNTGHGIFYDDSGVSTSIFKYNIFTDNLCSGNNGSGILLSFGKISFDGHEGNDVFLNNTCSFNNESGIRLNYYSSSNPTPVAGSVVNNICNSNKHAGIYFSGWYDLYISKWHGTTIAGNSCSGNNWSGITVQSSGSRVINNSCTGNNMNGIRISGQGENLIENNTAVSNTEAGFYISSSRNLLKNNTFNSNGLYGIDVNREDNEIVGSTIGHNGIGINLDGGYPALIFNNTIVGNGVGIYGGKLRDWAPHQIHNNSILNNTLFGVQVDQKGSELEYLVNLSHNYWCSNSGPYHPDHNPLGQGDNISEFVEFLPWLNENGTVNSSIIEERKDSAGESDGSKNTAMILVLGLVLFLSFSSLLLIASEPFRYALLRLLAPHYTRLTEENLDRDIAQQNIRGRIFSYVGDNPGSRLTTIRKETKAGYGTTVYHLSVLVREGYVRSANTGGRKLFWTRAEFPGFEVARLTEVQERILAALEEQGTLSRKGLEETTGIPGSTLHRNIGVLVERGQVVEEKRGKEHFCSLKKK